MSTITAEQLFTVDGFTKRRAEAPPLGVGKKRGRSDAYTFF